MSADPYGDPLDSAPQTSPANAAGEVDEASPQGSRAGRDLRAAVLVGVGLGAMVIASLVIRKEAFVAVVIVAIGVGVWELRGALTRANVQVPLVPVLAGVAGMILSAYAGGPRALVLAWVLSAALLVLWRVSGELSGAGRDVIGGMFVLTYPAFFAGFAAMLLAEPDGVARIVTFVLVTVCSDVGGYVAGVLFGKHPMAPRISPKKSWEGFAGSVLLCVLGALGCLTWILHGPAWAAVLFGVLVAVCATLGDLFESLIKRSLGVKDMSDLLPGHGGLMDRLDSLIAVVPVAWIVLAALVPVTP